MAIGNFTAVTEEEFLSFHDELTSYASCYHTEREFCEKRKEFNVLAQVISSGVRQGLTCSYIKYKPVKLWFIDKSLLKSGF